MHLPYPNSPTSSSLSNQTNREERAKESAGTIGRAWEAQAEKDYSKLDITSKVINQETVAEVPPWSKYYTFLQIERL